KWEAYKDYSQTNLPTISQAHHLAYVIYTSGSTGKPKGVMIEHKQINVRLSWNQEYIPLTTQDRYLHQFSFGFDGSVISLWWPLLNGTTVVIPIAKNLANIEYLSNLIEQYKLSTLFSTPTIINAVLTDKILKENQSIKRIIFGGEALGNEIIKRIKSQSSYQIYNFYGPTECSVMATAMDVTNYSNYASPPIGRPIANTSAYILTQGLALAPIGVSGELYIGGEGLARGYLNNPQLTKEKFIDNPFVSEADKASKKNLKLYKTGDLCRWLEDGTIEYLGRIDQQVKIRGFRIELGEIESLLLSRPDIEEVVVNVYTDDKNDKKIAAYIVPNFSLVRWSYQDICFIKDKQGKETKLHTEDISLSGICLNGLPLEYNIGDKITLHLLSTSHRKPIEIFGNLIWRLHAYSGVRFETDDKQFTVLKEFIDGLQNLSLKNKPTNEMIGAHRSWREMLKKHLPSYMIPSVFITLKSLPLTVHGKIDRNNLPMPFIQSSSTVLGPRTETESIIAKMWSEALQFDSIGIKDNFFDIGGHSMLITQLIYKLKKTFNKDISFDDFFNNPTIEQLANIIDNLININDSSKELELIKNDINLAKNIELKTKSIHLKIPQSIFLTGASGFLGVYLLEELIQSSNAQVYCLLRGETQELAVKHLNIKLIEYKLNNIVNHPRIIPVIGDLSKPQLGLNNKAFDKLAKEIDCIIHNGAYVHHLYDYAHLRTSNVLSTTEILKLASKHHLKPIHYISTLSAAFDKIGSQIQEDFPDQFPHGDEGGYPLSKWTSEKILKDASERGFKANIYRLPQIMGHTETGISPTENTHIMLLLKGCIQMGYAPDNIGFLNMMPVNSIANIIINVVFHQSYNRVFNLAHPESVTFSQIIEWLNQYGYSIKILNYKNWQESSLHSLSPDNAFYPLLSLYLKDEDIESSNITAISKPIIDNTKEIITNLNLHYLPLTKDLMFKYFDFLKKWFDDVL
ncbi:MAG: non-ribosomal peptide synthetase, partial [Francisellaceae bacterium]|nr:non-ribosomal peptide synthetase [Francisellaceae bacterium]